MAKTFRPSAPRASRSWSIVRKNRSIAEPSAAVGRPRRHEAVGIVPDRHQPLLPAAVAIEAFVGRVHEHALVVGRRARRRAVEQHAEVGEHRPHVRRLHRRQRQVVRAGRVAQPLAADRRGPGRGVAVRLRPGDQREARVPLPREAPGRGEPGDAGPDDGDVGHVLGGRRGPVRRLHVAQPMADVATGMEQARRELLPAPEADAPRRGDAGGAGRQQEAAALHRRRGDTSGRRPVTG